MAGGGRPLGGRYLGGRPLGRRQWKDGNWSLGEQPTIGLQYIFWQYMLLLAGSSGSDSQRKVADDFLAGGRRFTADYGGRKVADICGRRLPSRSTAAVLVDSEVLGRRRHFASWRIVAFKQHFNDNQTAAALSRWWRLASLLADVRGRRRKAAVRCQSSSKKVFNTDQ